MPAVAIFLGLRLISVTAYAVLVSVYGRYNDRSLFTSVDAGWYRLIATYGYSARAAAPFHGSIYGFFPFYPGVIHAGALVTGLGVDGFGLALTWIAAGAAAWAIFETGRLLCDARVGLLAAALWAVAPSSIFEAMLYADVLAIALSAWALYALLTRRWFAAGVLACLAGATRPTAVVTAAVVCCAAVVALIRRRDGMRPLFAALTAPIGAAAFLTFVAIANHNVTAYFSIQRASWGTYFDFGASTVERLRFGLTGHPGYLSAPAVITTAVLVVVPLLIAWQIIARQPWPLIGYCLGIAFVVYGEVHLYTTTPRELLPLYPLLIMPAALLARLPSRVLYPALFLVAAASGWYGAYVMTMTAGVIP